MTVAMVRFSAAFIDRRPSAARWGLAYGVSWAVLLWAMRRLIEDSRADLAGPPLLVLVVSGWGTFHALWMWLVLTASPERTTARRNAGFLGVAGLAIVAMAVVQIAAPSLRVGLPSGRPSALTLLMLTALLGIALLVTGGFLAGRRGRDIPASHDDDEAGEVADAFARRNAEAQPSLRQPRHAGTVVMAIGAGLVITGAFGAAIAAGPLPVQLLCGGALAFVAFQVLRYAAKRRT